VTEVAASRGDQTSAETAAGRGLFSTYLCGGLEGGAADVMGKTGAAGNGAGNGADGPGRGALPLVQGGRSNGARVACRTAAAAGAAGVIALAFPLHPPGHPERSRADELRVPGRKVLVVNGDRDPFGVPKRGAGRRVVVLAGETHALSRRPQAVGKAVKAWLPRVLGDKGMTEGTRGRDAAAERGT